MSFDKVPVDFLPSPVAEDYPVLQPGKSWSPNWTRSLPGGIEEGYAKGFVYALCKPGTYKLRVTLFVNPIAGDEPQTKRIKWLESNELELKVLEKAPAGKVEPAKGLKLTLATDKAETWMDSKAAYGAVPVKLKLTFTNTGDKPIKLDAYALPYRIKFHYHGPSPDSVKKQLVYVDQVLKPPTAKDYPVLQPGTSWSPSWAPAFPGDIPDGVGTIAGYSLRQPGTYKLRMTVYDTYAPHVEGAADGTKWLESNELELMVREKAPGGKVEPAKGLAVTAWGKPVEGIQAGLGFRPGENRAYHHGETVTLVVRLRNVGNGPVTISYLRPFFEHSLTVSNSEGAPILQPEDFDAKARHPRELTLPPGKEIEVHQLNRQLRPANESNSKEVRPDVLFGSGKMRVQYQQVFGRTEMVYRAGHRDPGLSKLATGTLELEIMAGHPGKVAPGAGQSDKEKAAAGKVEPAKGLKSTLSADKTEPHMVEIQGEHIEEILLKHGAAE